LQNDYNRPRRTYLGGEYRTGSTVLIRNTCPLARVCEIGRNTTSTSNTIYQFGGFLILMQLPRNGLTILVGEDEPEVRDYLEMALKCLGYSVELAEDGEEVLNYLKNPRKEIAAVLLDLMMPQKDGVDVLHELRQTDTNLPVIIVSGAGSTLNVVTAMKSGATDFLCKPVTHEELRRA